MNKLSAPRPISDLIIISHRVVDHLDLDMTFLASGISCSSNTRCFGICGSPLSLNSNEPATLGYWDNGREQGNGNTGDNAGVGDKTGVDDN